MCPAAKLLAAGVGAFLAIDGALVHRGHGTVSKLCGEHPVATTVALGYLWAHFMGRPRVLARLDPLAAAARLLAP